MFSGIDFLLQKIEIKPIAETDKKNELMEHQIYRY